MTPEEIEKVANEIHRIIRDKQAAFAIPAEEHYNDHLNLREIYAIWKDVKGIVMRIFIGFAVVGAAVLTGIGAVVTYIKGH